jgi:hypothetical protein
VVGQGRLLADDGSEVGVAPGWILHRHPDDELLHVGGDSRAPDPTARRAIVLAGDQLAVPAQDRVGCDQAGELAEPATADDPALDGQASPLVVGEAQAPSAELVAEHAVLLAQEVDDLELTGVNPARHAEDQEPHSFGAHRGTMVALPVIDLGPAMSTTTPGYASHSCRRAFGTRAAYCSSPASGRVWRRALTPVDWA